VVAWLCTPCYAVVAGVLAGIAAAVVSTAINGGNWGMNIGLGALFGGIAGAIGPGVFEGVGGDIGKGVDWSNFLPAVKAGVVVGAALGGLSTAFNPKSNFFQNVAFGALGGAAGGAIGFGIVKGATEWWNSMPGSDADSLGNYSSRSGKTVTNTNNGTASDRARVEAELDRLFETRTGQKVLGDIEAKIDAGGKPLDINLNNRGDNSVPRLGVINLDPNHLPDMEGAAGPFSPSIARVLLHEMSHAVYGNRSELDAMILENRGAGELGEPKRIRY
jgi:hypothetical protein